MAGQAATWHASDVASFDVAVELTHALTASVLQRRADEGFRARDEIIALRRALASLDPSDRAAVESFTSVLSDRIAELSS